MSMTTDVQDWAVLPYNTEKISGRYLVSNFFGSWDILLPEEFSRLEQLSLDEGSALFRRLYEKGMIVREANLSKAIHEYRNLQSHLFSDASLHIAVLTTRCNIACRYCQTRTEDTADMSLDTAAKIIQFGLRMRNPYFHLEFQGGEPLLNWEVLTFFVKNIKQSNVTDKNICISLVTNGVLLDDEKIGFLVDHGVNVCISLDGPAHVHDTNRVFSNGDGTYARVVSAIKKLKAAYQKRGMDRRINLLPMISRQSMPWIKEMIDEYAAWGAYSISLRPMNRMGGAQCLWDTIGYSTEEFNDCWAQAMDYILEINKQGIELKELMASVMLTKILKKQNPGHVDLMSPCGAGRSVLTYMPNGDIYPCDEARMAGADMFKLGNVSENTYDEVMKSPKVFSMCESSLMDLWDYNSAFLPWIGTCPVLNYMSQGNIIPKITQTPKHKVHTFQLTYLFKKMIEDKRALEIFQKWAA